MAIECDVMKTTNITSHGWYHETVEREDNFKLNFKSIIHRKQYLSRAFELVASSKQ